VADRGGFLTDADRAALDRFPLEIDDHDLRRCFALTEFDRSEIVERRYGPAGRLAAGLQLGALRLIGFVPADLMTAPADVTHFVAAQVDAAVSDLGDYTTRTRTRYDHVDAVERALGFRRSDRGDLKVLGDWLVERAMEHDRPIVLFRLACEHLRAERIVRPGVTTIERAVVTARQRAIEETYLRIDGGSAGWRRDLDGLLTVEADLDRTPLVWLRGQGSGPAAATIKEQLAKIERLRAIGAERIDLSALNPNRIRHLFGLGRRLTPQAIARLEPARRYQILAATVVELLVERIDDVLGLFDGAIAGIDGDARRAHEIRIAANGSVATETVKLFTAVAGVVLDPSVPDSEVRSTILNRVGPTRFEAALDAANAIAVPDTGHLDLVCSRYNRARQFAPQVLAAFYFHSSDPADPLLEAIVMLKELNSSGARLVPRDAPVSHASAKWQQHMARDDGRVDRRAWEMSTLVELRGALRGANVWVDHSRRYQDPLNYLLPYDQWARLRPEVPAATGISLDPVERLGELSTDLDAQLNELDVAFDDASTVRMENDRLVVTPLDAHEPDSDLEQLRDDIDRLLPEVELVDVLTEVNSWCRYLDELNHADNATHRTAKHHARLMAVIAAYGCNIGIEGMARSTEFSADQLAWTKTWHLRTETVRAANDAIVNHQIQQPIAEHWGTGTLSSSDGQRFPVTVKSPRASRNRKYFTGKGATIYTWTSDRHAQYGTRVIPTSVREATHVLDAIFDNETDLEIEEHTTDTAGYTDLIFGLFDLTGLRFSPRIKDLGDQRLWRLPATRTDGTAAQLLRHRIRPDRITERWDDMLRVAATIRHGHLPASLLVSRLQASARKNRLTQAIQEYGRIIKTISIVRYLHNEEHRRRIHTQLNKGESIHALRSEIHYANHGQIRRRDNDDQDLEGECLTLITNAVICWNTVYTQAAVAHVQSAHDGPIHEDLVARLSPTSHQHINFLGRYEFSTLSVPTDGKLRPLRI
jgi:TnpA family transposase